MPMYLSHLFGGLKLGRCLYSTFKPWEHFAVVMYDYHEKTCSHKTATEVEKSVPLLTAGGGNHKLACFSMVGGQPYKHMCSRLSLNCFIS